MKKLIYLLVPLFSLTVFNVEAKQWVSLATSFAAGDTGAVDAIDGQNLREGDTAIVSTSTGNYTYWLDSSASLTETSQRVISPDTKAGTKQWVLASDSTKYYVNPGAADQGSPGDDNSIYDIVRNIGTSKKATVILCHSGPGNTTSYTVTAALDLSSYSNINFLFENGAQLITSSSVTIYSPSNIVAQPEQQIVNGPRLFFSSGGGTVHPEWFGAKADNSTNSTTALQAAADSLKAGGEIELSIGTYRFTTLVLNNAGTTLRGKNWASVLAAIVAADSGTDSCLWVKASNCTVRDLKLTWARLPTALFASGDTIAANNTLAVGWGSGVTLYNTHIDHIYLHGAKQHGLAVGLSYNTSVTNSRFEAIYGTGLIGIYSHSIKIDGCEFYDMHDESISIASWGGNYVYDATVANCKLHDVSTGIAYHGVNRGVIANNEINNTWTSAILFTEDTTYGTGACKDIVIAHNVIHNPFEYYGVGLYHSKNYFDSTGGIVGVIEVESNGAVIITGNIIVEDSGITPGKIRCIYGRGKEKLLVSNNAISTGSAFPFFLGLRSGAAEYGKVEQLVMTGNILKATSGTGYAAIYLSGVDSGTISGNTLDCGGDGVNGWVLIPSFSKNINITGNYIVNQTQDIYTGGTQENITAINNSGLTSSTGYYAIDSQFSDSTSDINTKGKYFGKQVWSGTSNYFVISGGTKPTSVWYKYDGTILYSPTPPTPK